MEQNNTFGVDSLEDKLVLSVCELNALVKDILKTSFPIPIWVEGEVSRVKVHSSGHMYFVLKDEKASVDAVMFKWAKRKLKFELKHGMYVLCLVNVDLYEREGRYQIYVEDIQPKGVGALEMAFRQLKEKLEKEGLFSQDLKKDIPILPKAIGVITSPTGAAIKDIINVVRRRFPAMNILLYPVKVQGEGAAEEIASAIREMDNFFSDAVDVLIVGRGGGSIEDLWAFNEEVVARAISSCSIPIISAVGHEIDYTISDFVADKRAPTPSAAAELAVPDRKQMEEKLNSFALRMSGALKHRWRDVLWRLDRIRTSKAFVEPRYRIGQLAQQLDMLMDKMNQLFLLNVQNKRSKINSLGEKLYILSPLRTLERGYSIVFHSDGKIVNSTAMVKDGDRLRVRVKDGVFWVVKDGKKAAQQQYLF